MKSLNKRIIEIEREGLPEVISEDPFLLDLFEKWDKGGAYIVFGAYVYLTVHERETTALHFGFQQGVQAAHCLQAQKGVPDSRPGLGLYVIYFGGCFLSCLSVYVIVNQTGFVAWLVAFVIGLPAMFAAGLSSMKLISSLGKRKSSVPIPPMYCEVSREKFINGQGKEAFDKFYQRYGRVGPD